MGCNCATQEQIKKLHQLYGEKSNLNKTFAQKINEFFSGLLVYLVLFLISPLIIGFVLYKFFFTKNRQISIRKLLRFNGKGLDKALAANIIENTNIKESE
jgi:hypothetical protein